MSLIEGVQSIGPHKAQKTKAQSQAEHDRNIFLLGLEFGFKQLEAGNNLDAAIAHAQRLPLFEDKP